MQNQQEAVTETIHAELFDIFMDLNHDTKKAKEKASAQRKLAARRAIEQHFEKKRLEMAINDFWVD